MAIPEMIPIRYVPGRHTGMIGRWNDGQFLGSVAAAFPQRHALTGDRSCDAHWYTVLHTFDDAGHHIGSRIRRTGGDDDRRTATGFGRDRLARWLGALPGLRFGDIAIRPFYIEFDDVLFGLICEFEGDEHAELYPDLLGFYEPWDGSYET
ncbi:hypothetical protein [Planomonospora sp. ID82291]|uniref:hypothetical protein n=1 Tax=Planomonospora sp. ID82291 TaxID=2738136 RepID=UPI0018C419D9|nr:hypothetical protein [Planomonospora sp. ID82291]MBG0817876.1 hypothetical protein [Planomonospora sp. ID82291]